MFVSRNSLSGKPLSKLSCVCLPLEKLVNGKHFPVNGKHFPVNGNTFRSTENTFQSTENTFQSTETLFEFGLVFRKVFFLLAVFVFRKVISGKPLSKLSCVGQRKTLSSQRKIWLGFQESVFLENLGGKHFPEVVKNLEMSYLLIISNLILKLLIAIYNLF